MDWTALSTPVIIALIPILILLLKQAIPDRFAWLYPLMATAMGPALDWINGLLLKTTIGSGRAVLLGMAAIGLREILDQIKKARIR